MARPRVTPSTVVRDRLYAAQAQRAERLNQVEAGELIPAGKIEEEWKDIVITIRQRLLAIPARVAAAHPGNSEIVKTVDREIRAALANLADHEL